MGKSDKSFTLSPEDVKDIADGLRNEGSGEPPEEKPRKRRGRAARKQIELEAAEAKAKELDIMFSPENFKALVQFPGELGHALTGWPGFLLTEDERALLAAQGSMTARYWLQIEPKYIALFMFSISLMQIYGSRYIVYTKQIKPQGGIEPEKPAEHTA